MPQPTLLRVDSSSRTDGSHTRVLGDYAESLWRRAEPDGRVIRRELADGGIEILEGRTVAAFRTPIEDLTAEQAGLLKMSETLIAELKSATTLLITAPMYNYTVSSALKAWIDHVSRNGHTFEFDAGAYKGLLTASRAIVVCAYGTQEFQAGRMFADNDYLQPYLKFLLNNLGIPAVDFVPLHGTTTDPQSLEALYAKARSQLDHMLSAPDS